MRSLTPIRASGSVPRFGDFSHSFPCRLLVHRCRQLSAFERAAVRRLAECQGVFGLFARITNAHLSYRLKVIEFVDLATCGICVSP